MTDFAKNTQERATLGGGEGDPAGSSSDIQAFIEGQVEKLGTYHTSEATLPPDTEDRGVKGTFISPDDLEEYLRLGGLVLDKEDGTIQKNPIVHILRVYNPYDGRYEYEVWIEGT